MKRVKQISLDILVDESVDGCDLAEIIANICEENGHRVLGAGFQEDMTDVYQYEYGYGEVVNGGFDYEEI